MEEVPDDIREDIVKFTCIVYGKKKLTSINEVRFQIFSRKYKPNEKKNKTIMDVKSLDGSAMRPCSRVLQEKITRVPVLRLGDCLPQSNFIRQCHPETTDGC